MIKRDLSGEKNPMFGKHHSKKTREKISLALMGRHHSKKTRRKMRGNHADLSGEKHPMWKGGTAKTSGGYIIIYSPNHPFKEHNYVREHRLIMEQWLRENNPDHPALIEIEGEIYLRPEWIPHHKNERKDDNRIENLELMTDRKHKSYHASGEKHPMFGRTGDKHPFYGKHHSRKSREKMSLSKVGEKNPMFGKHHKQNQPRDEITGRFVGGS